MVASQHLDHMLNLQKNINSPPKPPSKPKIVSDPRLIKVKNEVIEIQRIATPLEIKKMMRTINRHGTDTQSDMTFKFMENVNGTNPQKMIPNLRTTDEQHQ